MHLPSCKTEQMCNAPIDRKEGCRNALDKLTSEGGGAGARDKGSTISIYHFNFKFKTLISEASDNVAWRGSFFKGQETLLVFLVVPSVVSPFSFLCEQIDANRSEHSGFAATFPKTINAQGGSTKDIH
jgi:hypothetical protein